jgi:hypothetical protein
MDMDLMGILVLDLLVMLGLLEAGFTNLVKFTKIQ